MITCNEDNGGCGRKRSCIQLELGVTCSCDLYKESEEDNMLARGKYSTKVIERVMVNCK